MKTFFTTICPLAAAMFVSGAANAQIITTVAGNGTYGYTGDGFAAVSAELALPIGLQYEGSGVVIDHSGNMLIADEYNNVIRKVNGAGVITTIVGTGYGAGVGSASGTYNGDGITATAADLNNPSGLTVDASENIYIADYYNSRVRKVNAAGIISTVAGNGTFGTSAGDGAAATAATLGTPNSVALDAAGNIYFSDDYNHVVRKVNVTTGIITTIAGTGTSGYNGDGIAATSAQLYRPWGIAFDAHGNTYIADCGNNRVRMINASGTITTVAGDGTTTYVADGVPASSTAVAEPRSIAFNALGNYYIAEGDGRIREVNTSGITSTVAGNGTNGFSGDGAAATLAALNRPIGVALDNAGNLYIVDEENDRIRKVGLSALQISTPVQAPELTIYGNPSHNTIRFQVAVAGGGSATAQITNMLGEKIKEWPVIADQETETTVNAPGAYILTVTATAGSVSRQVVVQ